MNKLIKFGTISGGLLLLGGVVLTTASLCAGSESGADRRVLGESV